MASRSATKKLKGTTLRLEVAGERAGAGWGNTRWALDLQYRCSLLVRDGFHERNQEIARGGALERPAAHRLRQLKLPHRH